MGRDACVASVARKLAIGLRSHLNLSQPKTLRSSWAYHRPMWLALLCTLAASGGGRLCRGALRTQDAQKSGAEPPAVGRESVLLARAVVGRWG